MSRSDALLVIRDASSATEIELADARFRVVETFHGGAEIHCDVAPGVYSLRFSEMGSVAYVDVLVPGGAPTVVTAPVPAAPVTVAPTLPMHSPRPTPSMNPAPQRSYTRSAPPPETAPTLRTHGRSAPPPAVVQPAPAQPATAPAVAAIPPPATTQQAAPARQNGGESRGHRGTYRRDN